MSIVAKNRFPTATGRRSAVRVQAASWSKATTTGALKAAGAHYGPLITSTNLLYML